MVFYEVNIQIKIEIFEDYMMWLKEHVEKMLSFDGFEDAKVYEQVDNDDPLIRNITVFYSVKDHESLQSYFNKHASAMRNDGVQRFSGQFCAKRRVLEMI